MTWKRTTMASVSALFLILICGFLLPDRPVIPVLGASSADWNSRAFWHRPWGKSGVHRGIDIFAPKGRPVISSCSGLTIFVGTLRNGGNVVAILGPRWRVHYYAHLASQAVTPWQWVRRGDEIGTVGDTGNAIGKPSHLHYALVTQIPYVWRYRPERFGIDRMFYLDPGEWLLPGGSIPTRPSSALSKNAASSAR